MEVKIETSEFLDFLIKKKVLRVKKTNDILWIPKFMTLKIVGNSAAIEITNNPAISFLFDDYGQIKFTGEKTFKELDVDKKTENVEIKKPEIKKPIKRGIM
jgi:hypothetical protein